MKRLAFLTIVILPMLGAARPAWAEPAWGVNCLSCHGEMQMDVLVVIGEDTMADPDETNTGAPDRGLLKTFEVYRGPAKTLQAEVVGLGVGDRYAVELKRLRYPGVEDGADLSYLPDCAWAYWGSPGEYYTDPAVGYRGESGPTVFNFDISVDPANPDDYFDLTFAVAGKFDDGVLFYGEEHFYIHVSQLPGDMDGDGDVDTNDYDLFVGCYTGPGGGPITPGCEPGDFDGDDDIDCDDWDGFVLAWTAGGEPPVFAQCVVVPPVSPPSPDDVPKNRYLTIDPTPNLREVAYQVELTESVPYPSAVGRTWWLDVPVCYDMDGNECPGPSCLLDPIPPDCVDAEAFGWVSGLTTTPVTRTWVESPLHITGCGVAPVVTFEVKATSNEGGYFSDPLEVFTVHKPDGVTQSWGDVTGGPDPVNPGQWLPPEGAMNMADIGNSIRTFENRTEDTGFPPRVWVDVEGNRVINLADIQFLIMAFEGVAYADINDLDYIGWHPGDCP